MLIYTQSEILVNSEHIKWIWFDEDNGRITAYMIDNTTIVLGTYGNGYEAEQIMQKIAQSYGAINTFTMPHREELKE